MQAQAHVGDRRGAQRCTRMTLSASTAVISPDLRWHDIDLDHGEVSITGSAAVIAGQRIEGTTKSGRSRTVSIDPGTVQVLRDHRKRQAGERLKVGPEWRGTDDYVFSTAWASRSTPTRCRRLRPRLSISTTTSRASHCLTPGYMI